MKKILVIKGDSAYNVLRRAVEEICQGFRNKNFEVDIVDFMAADAEIVWMDKLAHWQDDVFCFSFQAILWNEEKDFQSLLQMKRVGWIVDAPIYHVTRLEGSTGKGSYLLTILQSHMQEVQERYRQIEHVNVLYHGGFEESQQKKPFAQRSVDVFFPGTYVPVKETEQKLDRLEGIWKEIAEEIKKRLRSHLNSTWLSEIDNYLNEINIQLSELEHSLMRKMLYRLDEYHRGYIREKVISALLSSGIRVTVAGMGWEKWDGPGKERLQIISGEGLDINEVIAVMEDSKVVMNITNFFDGMHERIFTAMLAKAVCVTNEYKLVNEFFEPGKDILEFRLDDIPHISVLVQGILEDSKRAEGIVESAYQKAKAKHTWVRRGEQIVEWVEEGKEIVYE